MFWQSFVGTLNFNFTTNVTNLIFQLNQNGAGYYLAGTSINNATLIGPSQFNIKIQNGYWPDLIPFMTVQNIENTQFAQFAISPVAAKSTSFS